MRSVVKHPQPPKSLVSKTTNELRIKLIAQKKYPLDDKTYDGRYKTNDIKDALKKIYNNKCAYCEQNINDTYFHIEHYRPKSIYYWLAYSWDNLLLCCTKCNAIKQAKFAIAATAIDGLDEKDRDNIHQLTPKYNAIEKPLLVNPELEDIEDKLVFKWETGFVEAPGDQRCQYTIDCCRLDRKEANENRQKIWDDFDKKVEGIIYQLSLLKKSHERNEITEDDYNIGHRDYMVQLKAQIGYFKQEAYDDRKEYLAFRRYIVKNYVLFKKISNNPVTEILHLPNTVLDCSCDGM